MLLVMEIANDIGVKEIDEMFSDIERKYKHVLVEIGVEARIAN